MQIKSSKPVRGNFSYQIVSRAKEPSKYSLWKSLPIAGSILTLFMVIAAFPSWADERQNASVKQPSVATTIEDVSLDIKELQVELEELQEISEWFDSAKIPTIGDLPVYSTQAKDLLVQNTPEPTTKSTTAPVTETTTESTSELETDTSGTNPAVLNRTLSFDSEYTRLTTGNYLSNTTFRFAQPFADNRMSIRLKVPLVGTDVLGEGRFGLGDISTKWTWVADINLKTALVVEAELFAPTASDRVLGSGKWSLAPSLIYAFFINKNIIIAPAYIHNFSFAGDSDRADIHRGDFDLYIVYTADDKSWWVTSDLALSFDYQNGKTPAAWKVQFGRNLGKLTGGGAINGFIKPGIGIGGDRAFDWSIQVGLSLIGF